jgi:hypothetical protein
MLQVLFKAADNELDDHTKQFLLGHLLHNIIQLN